MAMVIYHGDHPSTQVGATSSKTTCNQLDDMHPAAASAIQDAGWLTRGGY
jgi:hypothetical protein